MITLTCLLSLALGQTAPASQQLQGADKIIAAMELSIQQKRVTYDFARLMEGATQVSCSGFGQVLIENM